MSDKRTKKSVSPRKRRSGAEFVKWMGPILDSLRALGNSGTPTEVSEQVVRTFGIPDHQLEEVTETGVPRFYNQVAWARQYLVWEGLLSSARRGVWALTETGKATHLNEESSRAVFLKWVKIHADRRKQRAGVAQAGAADDVAIVVESDPGELAEVSELLGVLQRMTPEGFENFCKFLLRVYGFESVHVTPRGKDGGIDGHGVLQLNPFVSFRVVFQCKRYRKSVSRPQIADFRNGMLGRAEKGILITTGVFTEDARREASRDGAPPIELIDGTQLVELLQRERVGVTMREVFDVDYEFFRPYMPKD